VSNKKLQRTLTAPQNFVVKIEFYVCKEINPLKSADIDTLSRSGRGGRANKEPDTVG
jgi:hypothetical protein